MSQSTNYQRWKKDVLEQAQLRNHTILEDPAHNSDFRIKNSFIWWECNRCHAIHCQRIIAYLRTSSTGCNNCKTGRGRTGPTIQSPETIARILRTRKERGTRGAWLNKTGPAHGAYRGGVNRSERDYSNAWSLGICRQYKGRCFITGERKNCVAHHLYSRSTNPDLRNDTTNGVWIKRDIHEEFHRDCGKGRNTPQQFENWCYKKFGLTEFPWRQQNYSPPTLEEILKDLEGGRIYQTVKLFDHPIRPCHKFVDFLDEKGNPGGEYKTQDSVVNIFCEEHRVMEFKPVINYTRARAAGRGTLCCGRIASRYRGKFQSNISGTSHAFYAKFQPQENFTTKTRIQVWCYSHSIWACMTVENYVKYGMKCCNCSKPSDFAINNDFIERIKNTRKNRLIDVDVTDSTSSKDDLSDKSDGHASPS